MDVGKKSILEREYFRKGASWKKGMVEKSVVKRTTAKKRLRALAAVMKNHLSKAVGNIQLLKMQSC